MPKTREESPRAKVTDSHVDEKLALCREWDAKEPEFAHVWKNEDSSDFDRWQAEIVKVKEKPITNRLQVLCRIPREIWDGRNAGKEELSKERMRSIWFDKDGNPLTDSPLTFTENPKKPITGEI